MDRLKKLFRRKKRNDTFDHAPATPTSPPVSKRPRSPSESIGDAMEVDNMNNVSPRKRVRQDLPDLTLHQQHSRVDSHSGSTESGPVAPVAPKLDLGTGRGGGGDFSSTMFDNISTDRLQTQRVTPRVRPFSQTDPHRKQPSLSNRHSLDPVALFARAQRRFHEEPSEEEQRPATQADSRPSETTDSVIPATTQTEARPTAIRDSMTLDDILSQPLFGDGPATNQESSQPSQQRYFSHLSEPFTPFSPEVPQKVQQEPEPQQQSKPKRHPLIP